MGHYKGFDVEDKLYAVIRHMSNVDSYREDLHQQQIVWDYLSVLGQLARLDNQLSVARKQFSQLTGVLLNRIGLELLKKTTNAYAFKAQVAIDIMLRNLFERTADIGFLATDDDIRAYLLQLKQTPSADMRLPSEKLRERFRQYVDKYSVYHNIILLDTQGKVVLQLDQNNPVTHSKDPLIEESLHTTEAYVEHFRYSDLLPNADSSLIYSYRVTSPDQSAALGVVCLCFRFENECEGIFSHLLEADESAILCLLNTQGQVIASVDSEKIPLNTKLKLHPEADYNLLNCNGVEYFCCTRASAGYQGYRGAGWLGHVMVPLDKVFKQSANQNEHAISSTLLEAIMQGSVFVEEIKSIPLQANQIQRELNRLVWNGNVQQSIAKNSSDAAVSKVLLGEIKNTGTLTKQIFEKSITNIQTTVITTALQDSASMAALAIDIMDRNLYERANDCRWWALNTTFRELLAQKNLSEKDVSTIQSILSYINGLYTVYSNLLVFDKYGAVLAVSNSQYQSLLGSKLNAPWVSAINGMATAQHYAVSDFVVTPLYNNLASYIYVAAIRSMDNTEVLGGVAIVFDSAPQFKAMLQDVLPRDAQGEALENCFAVYVDADKKIISSTHVQFTVGTKFEVEDEFYALKNGQSMSKITHLHVADKQQYFALGCSKSRGYREYKGPDDVYQSDVYAFVCIYLGEVQTQSIEQDFAQHEARMDAQVGLPLATFFVEGNWLALRAEQVDSAVPLQKLVPIRGSEPSIVAGYMIYKDNSLALIHTSILLGTNKVAQAKDDVVVVKIQGSLIGLLVDELGEMIDVPNQWIQPIDADIAMGNQIVNEIVLSDAKSPNEPMLQLVDIDLLSKQLASAVQLA